MGDVIVLTVLGIIVALVIRSMWRSHKKGGGCSGCSGCSHKCEGTSACNCDCVGCAKHGCHSVEQCEKES